jgi:hypothetical protein
MKLQGAVIKEQGITFAIACVKPEVVDNSNMANEAISSLYPIFGRIPVILMAQNSNGQAKYYGRRDIAQFMSNVPFRAIPWREYTIN